MAPLEAQIRQHRDQLRQRQGSIQRIHDATDGLEQKIEAFEEGQAELERTRLHLLSLAASVTDALGATAGGLKDAA